MDRLGTRPLRGLDDPLADEVALGCRAGADQVRLVGGAHVQRVAVGLGVDGDRPIPSSRSVRKIRIAISPRFATSTFEKSGIGPRILPEP